MTKEQKRRNLLRRTLEATLQALPAQRDPQHKNRSHVYPPTRVVEVRVAEVADADYAAVQVVDGDSGPEETLDLSAVEVHGHHAVDP